MNLVLQLGALAVALVAVGAFFRAVFRAWKKVDAFLEDWNGEPARAGREPRPSMPARMAHVELELGQVKDRLKRVETAINNV